MLANVGTVVAPAALPVSWDEAAAHLRLDGEDDRPLVESMIGAATAHAEGELQRSLVARTLELAAAPGDCAGGVVEARFGPVSELMNVNGEPPISSEGSLYRFSGYDVVLARAGSRDAFVFAGYPRVARVVYLAGYGDPADVPPDLRLAILMHVGHLYRYRESATDRQQYAVAGGLDAIYARHRVGGPL